MARSSASTTRKVVGLGFLPEEARHGFLIDVPKGTSSSDMICITEHRGNDLDSLGARATQPPQPNAPGLRVVIDRARWLALAPAFWDEANRRLRANVAVYYTDYSDVQRPSSARCSPRRSRA